MEFNGRGAHGPKKNPSNCAADPGFFSLKLRDRVSGICGGLISIFVKFGAA